MVGADGLPVGARDGLALGLPLGACDGLPLGEALGLAVGLALGLADGLAEGLAVARDGEAVGCLVYRSLRSSTATVMLGAERGAAPTCGRSACWTPHASRNAALPPSLNLPAGHMAQVPGAAPPQDPATASQPE